MKFDKSRVYTSLNAENLKIGSKVICAFTISKGNIKRYAK